MALFSYTKVGVGDVIESTGTLVLRALGHISVDNKRVTDLANPTGPQDAATMSYVDAAVAGVGIPTLTNVLTAGNNAGALQIVNLANPLLAQDAATKFYVDGGDAATLASANAHADAGDVTTLASANAYTDAAVAAVPVPPLASVLVAGNSAGAKIVNLTDPTAAQDAATKNYVDTRPAPPADTLTAVLTAGNNAGALQIVNLANPTLAQDAATKFYVDGAVKLSVGTNKINVSNGTGGWLDTDLSIVSGQDIHSATGNFRVIDTNVTFDSPALSAHSFLAQTFNTFRFIGSGAGEYLIDSVTDFSVNGVGTVNFNSVGAGGKTMNQNGFNAWNYNGTGVGGYAILNVTSYTQSLAPGGGTHSFTGGSDFNFSPSLPGQFGIAGVGNFKVSHPTNGISLNVDDTTAASKVTGRFLMWEAGVNVYAEAVPTGSVTPSKFNPLRIELGVAAAAVTGPAAPMNLTQINVLGSWPALTGTTQQEVPEPGKYRVLAFLNITTTATTNPTTRAADLGINGADSGRQISRGTRWSGLAADDMELGAKEQVVYIDDPPNQKLSLLVTSGTWSTTGGTNLNRFIIEKLSDLALPVAWPAGVPVPDVWWDVSDSGTVVTGGAIESVPNKGTNLSVGPLTQVNAALRPPANYLSGRRAANFQAVPSTLNGPQQPGSPLNPLHQPGTNCTVSAMLKATTAVSGRPLNLTKGSIGIAKGFQYLANLANWQLLVCDGVTQVSPSVPPISVVGNQRTAIRKQGATYDTKVNNAVGIVPTVFPVVAGDGSGGCSVGGLDTGANGFFGSIGEIMIWLTVALTDTQLTAVDSYMRDKWGP